MPLIDLIIIGTELILGRIQDTNAHWLAQRVTEAGGRVRRVTTVRDAPEDIVAAIQDAAASGATHIITTGGLGPTPDDMTVDTVARLVGCRTVVDGGLIRHFRKRLRLEGREQVPTPMRKVATIPEAGIAAPNRTGWGHCIMVPYGDAMIFILPGPPREVRALFEAYIEPGLREAVGKD